MTDRLRPLWDFDDLDATEVRLREQLEREVNDEGRAEVLTQLARVEGLRENFDAGERQIEEAEVLAGESSVARARIDLERGRLRRSSGNADAAFPLFESAYAISLAADEAFIAADSAHMAALAAGDREGFVAWTQRGIELAGSNEDAAHWLGPLLNNLGWEYYDAKELTEALDAFQRALVAREQEPDDRASIEIARYAVGKTLRALGRSEEAVPVLEHAVAWATGGCSPDGWFHEELAEEYAALGREHEASEQARLAIPLLEADDPSFSSDPERTARLRHIAGLPNPGDG